MKQLIRLCEGGGNVVQRNPLPIFVSELPEDPSPRTSPRGIGRLNRIGT